MYLRHILEHHNYACVFVCVIKNVSTMSGIVGAISGVSGLNNWFALLLHVTQHSIRCSILSSHSSHYRGPPPPQADLLTTDRSLQLILTLGCTTGNTESWTVAAAPSSCSSGDQWQCVLASLPEYDEGGQNITILPHITTARPFVTTVISIRRWLYR